MTPHHWGHTQPPGNCSESRGLALLNLVDNNKSTNYRKLQLKSIRKPECVLPDQASLQLLMAASGVCDLCEQSEEGLEPVELQGQQGV